MNLNDVKRTKIEYSSNNPIYKGYHLITNASVDDPNWIITKFTYDGTDITDIQISEGSWTNRATLGW
jgi:hypothetical protein